MKTLCESMLLPSVSNWLDLLRAADRLDSSRLMKSTLNYLKQHVFEIYIHCNNINENNDKETTQTRTQKEEDEEHVQAEENDWFCFQNEFPDLYNELVTPVNLHVHVSVNNNNIQLPTPTTVDSSSSTSSLSFTQQPRPPSSVYIKHMEFIQNKQNETVQSLNNSIIKFPYLKILFFVTSLLIYYFLTLNASFMHGNLIVFFNIIYLVGFIFYIYYSLVSDK